MLFTFRSEPSTRASHREPGPLTTILLVFVLLTCLRVWLAPAGAVEPVQAQIPDAGAQRRQQVDEARLTNQLLSDIKRILESGTLHVRLEGADNPSEPRRGAPMEPSPGSEPRP